MPLAKSFRDLVDDAKTRIVEIAPSDLAAKLTATDGAPVIIDVREAEDYNAGHVAGSRSVPRGVLELKIDEVVPDTDTEIVLYCGGGSRSALAADTLQTMGYTNVKSLTGGFHSWSNDPSRAVETG